MMMFSKTLTFSEIKTSPEIFKDMDDSDVFQIFYRRGGVKVMMTQEKYFNLLQKIERLEGNTKRTEYNSEELLQKLSEFMNKE